MSSYANPQSLNRYSYVLNNPLLYIDPTGHIGEGTSGCGVQNDQCISGTSASIKPASNNASQLESPKHHRPHNDSGSTGENNQKNKNTSDAESPLDEMIQTIDFSVKGMHLLDLVEDGIQWGRPAYRQVKYAAPLGGLEWGVDAGLQLYDDRNMDLTVLQRGGRALVRMGESAAIDGLSTGIGLAAAAAVQATNLELPGVAAGVGYIVGSYSTSAILDNVAKQNNLALFSSLGLGGP